MKSVLKLAGLAILAVLPFIITSSYYLPLITTIVIYSILVLGLDIVFGYTGEVSIGNFRRCSALVPTQPACCRCIWGSVSGGRCRPRSS